MALKKTITKEISINNADMIKSAGVNIPSSIALPDVYFKIKSLEGDKNSLKINLEGIYSYQSISSIQIVHSDGNEEIVEQNCEVKEVIYSNSFKFFPSIEDGSFNFIKQGYEYLKTLDEFKDAIDC